MIRYMLGLVVAVLLVGCQSTIPTVVNKYNLVNTPIPETLLEIHPISPPPNRDSFINGNDATRLKMMVDYNIELLETLGKYRSQTQHLKEYNDEINRAGTDSLRKDQ